jgi:hypothetical protein
MTNSGNPFLLFKERNINELFSVSFQYLKKYKRSFFIPLMMVGIPIQMIIFYLYMDYYGIINSNPWLMGSAGNAYSGMLFNFIAMLFLALLSQSFSMSLIFSHLKLFATNEFYDTDKEPQELTIIALKLLPKTILILIVSFFLLMFLTVPISIIFILFFYLLSFSGGFAAGILFVFLFFVALLFMTPPFFYILVITPFTLLNKNPEDGYLKTFKKNFKQLFSNFWKTWLYSLLLVILFYLSEMLVMMPILITLLTGLFVKSTPDIMDTVTKIIVSSIASFIQIIVINILIILFLYLYGSNEEKISKRSLKQEIENL